MATTLVLVLVLISSILIHGITLTERSLNGLDGSERSDLLDRYNTYTGAIFSVLIMPFQQVVLLVMPVFFLCFATSSILGENKSFVQMWMPLGFTVVTSLLIGQGMNAVNVQFDSPRTDYIITADDLVASDTGEVSFVISNISDSTSIAGIPSTDTILRNTIQFAASSDQTSCTSAFGWPNSNKVPEASIRFGFPTRSWLENLLPTSLASDSSFEFSMSDHFSADSTTGRVIPDWTLDKTAQIFSYGLSLSMMTFVTDGSAGYSVLPVEVYDAIKVSDDVQMLNDMQTVILNYTSKLHNVSVAEITVQFSSFQLSDQIQFDAVTFELPIDTDTMQTWLNESDNGYSVVKIGTDYFNSFDTALAGNDHAFVMKTPKMTDDQVRILRLCLKNENDTIDDLQAFTGTKTRDDAPKCDFPSTTSAMIMSLGQHITMDEANVYTNEYNFRNLMMKNPRKVYSVTVGKLSWRTSDLAHVYGATCSEKDQCEGLYFPLTGNQHIVVGKDHIPLPSKNFSFLQNNWQVLVNSKTEFVEESAVDKIQTTFHIDLIYPPIYPMASDSLPWNQSGDDCSEDGAGFIDDIIQRHIYSKDSMQPAYTAGMFWLFGNATLHTIDNSTRPGIQNAVRLDFVGNQKWISPRISMPRTSAIMTIIGSGLIFMAALAINVWARNQNQQEEFQRHLFSAHNVGGILFNSSQFPPLLLRTKIQQPAKDENTQEPNDELGAYTITEMTLRRRTDAAQSAVYIRSTDADELPL